MRQATFFDENQNNNWFVAYHQKNGPNKRMDLTKEEKGSFKVQERTWYKEEFNWGANMGSKRQHREPQ